jgi:hypothetical protein
MTLVIMTDDGPVEEALLNGYSFGDRRLENVMFRIQIKDGKINCPGVTDSSQRYMNSYHLSQVAEWMLEAEQTCQQLGDTLETVDGLDAWIENVESTPSQIQPKAISKVNINDLLSRAVGPKTG